MFEDLTKPGGSAALVRPAFDAIFAGAWTPVQVAGFAVTLRLRGESAEVISAAVQALRSVMVRVSHGLPATLDTCGTGGDGLGTLNISTAAAIVVAADGIPVAKHGNRSVSSKAGSADVLEALGIRLELTAERQVELLRSLGIAFLFAPSHHAAMKHGGVARRELGIRTVFNAIGPLANPALVTHQLIGAYDDGLRQVMARTLVELGGVSAWIVRGEDGLDEVSPSAPTRVTVVDGGQVREQVVSPETFGLSRLDPSAIAGGDAHDNAKAIREILSGRPHPARDAVVLNAAAAMCVFRQCAPEVAARRAQDVIAKGAGLELLQRWVSETTRP